VIFILYVVKITYTENQQNNV